MLGQQYCDMLCWDVAIVWPGLRNSLLAKAYIEMVTNFYKRPGTKFLSPIFHNALNTGLSSFLFTRWQTQYKEREHVKQLYCIVRFYFNYFAHYSGTNTQGSHRFIPNFSFRGFNMVQIWFRYGSDIKWLFMVCTIILISEQAISECNLKTVCCRLSSIICQNPAGDYLEFHQHQPALSDNPGNNVYRKQ